MIFAPSEVIDTGDGEPSAFTAPTGVLVGPPRRGAPSEQTW